MGSNIEPNKICTPVIDSTKIRSVLDGSISIKAKSVQIDAMKISKHCAFFYVLLDDFSITMYYSKIKP